MSKEKRENYLKYAKPHKLEWILIILAGLILGSFYLYSDMAFTSSCGVKFWNCIVNGTFPIFYHEGYTGAAGSILEFSMGGSYDFALYLMFALYNFPIWIWEKITGFSFMQFIFTREYIKGIVWIFSGINAYLIYKIACECDINKEEAKWASFIFLSSGIFFYTEVVMGGYDVISVSFTLIGIYGYLKKNNTCFVVAFAMAIAMKMFAVFLFIPLVLLKEKRIWKVLLYGLGGISVIAIPKIYFTIASHRFLIKRAIDGAIQTGKQVDVIAESVGYASNGIIDHGAATVNEALFPEGRMLEYTFISMNALPLVFVCMFALWVFCYLYKKEMTRRQIIYVCAVTMSIFVLTVKIHPQWCIILMPYLALIMMFQPEKMKDNLILEGLFSLGYVLNKALAYYWTCNLCMIENMMKPQHSFSYGSPEVTGSDYGFSYYVARISDKTGISTVNFAYMFKAAAVAGLIMFLIWNFPGRKREGTELPIDYKQRRKWLLTRFAISCMIGMLPMLGLVIYLT